MASKQSPTLLSLPTEILQLVLANTHPSSLPTIRQTCKRLAKLGEKPFGNNLLAEKHVVMTASALNGVITLLEDQVFGVFVQKLLFSTQRVEQRATILLSAIQEKKLGSVEAMEMLRKHDGAAAAQQTFIHSGLAGRLMLKIFTILKSRKSRRVEVGVYDESRGYGYTACFGALGSGVWYTRPGGTLQILVRACMDARYRPNNLSLELEDWNRGSTGDNERFGELVGRLAGAGAAGKIGGGLHLCLSVGGEELILDSEQHGIVLRTAHTASGKSRVQGYTLEFLMLRLFQAGINALHIHNVKIAWRDIKTIFSFRGDNITDLEIAGVDISCAEEEEVLLPDLLNQHLPFERVVLEDLSVVIEGSDTVASDDEDDDETSNDTTAEANENGIENIDEEIHDDDTSDAVIAAIPEPTILIEGKHQWNGSVQVRRGLDTMIEQREQAQRESDERFLMDLQLQFALSEWIVVEDVDED